MKGYALNNICYAFNQKANHDAFAADEEGFMEKHGLNEEQKQAIRDILALLEAGGNIYYLAKFAGIFKLSVQDLGALQTGVTTEKFKQKLLNAADQKHGKISWRLRTASSRDRPATGSDSHGPRRGYARW